MPVNDLSPVKLEELLASQTSTASDKQVEPDLVTLLAEDRALARLIAPDAKEQIFESTDIDELIRVLLANSVHLHLNADVRADDEIHISPRAEGELDLLTLLNQ